MTDDVAPSPYPSPDRVAELAAQCTVGMYLTIDKPLPMHGWIEERTEDGVLIRNPGGATALLTWFGLHHARIERR